MPNFKKFPMSWEDYLKNIHPQYKEAGLDEI
jgi:hypothetical protein